MSVLAKMAVQGLLISWKFWATVLVSFVTAVGFLLHDPMQYNASESVDGQEYSVDSFIFASTDARGKAM